MTVNFAPGKNIAIKVPSHEYDRTVTFYRDVLKFKVAVAEASDPYESIGFDFGGKVLWVDKIDSISQAEIWLEVTCDDVALAESRLAGEDCSRCDGIETLTADIRGFWIASPANIIHLVCAAG